MGIELRASVVNPKDIATKEYVDNSIAGVISYDTPVGIYIDNSINATAPTTLSIGPGNFGNNATVLFPYLFTRQARIRGYRCIVTTSGAGSTFGFRLYRSNNIGLFTEGTEIYTQPFNSLSLASTGIIDNLFTGNQTFLIDRGEILWVAFTSPTASGALRALALNGTIALLEQNQGTTILNCYRSATTNVSSVSPTTFTAPKFQFLTRVV